MTLFGLHHHPGGHIKNAMNLNSPYQLEHRYFSSANLSANARVCILFHCEYSQQRGPNLCGLMRELDRKINLENYPRLFYPQIYVISGGFKEFHQKYPELCSPAEYVPMTDERYTEVCAQSMSQFRKDLSTFRNRLKSRFNNHSNKAVSTPYSSEAGASTGSSRSRAALLFSSSD
jgi:M-phase inducer tyrosine phosphatase